MNCPSCLAENGVSASTCVRCGTTLSAPTSVVVTVDLSPGTLFHGRYEILGPLGHGGMGMVYKARDRTLEETVAIKILRPDFAQNKLMADRFKSEIKLARRVRHRNVCTIHDFGEEQGLLFISMEFIEGLDLKRLLRERGGLPPEEAYDLAIQVAEGLQAVHEAGIIHRDLKTPNIMRDTQGMARLMDFGIAKRQDAETLTATGHLVGTPEYMSPEQGQGQKVDFRSDVYALGVVTYEMFTGRVPFRGDTPISTILKHIHDPPPLEGRPADKIPPDLKPVLGRALAKDPSARYSTARDFAEGLRRARSPSSRQETVATEALEMPTLPAPPRRPLQAWLLVLPVAAVAAGVFMLSNPWRRPSPAAAEPAAPSTESAAAAAPAPPTLPATSAPLPPAAMMAAPPAARPRPTSRMAGAAHLSPTPVTRAADPSPPEVGGPAPTQAPSPKAESPAAEANGMLQVVCRPWAEVSVDGRRVGETPLDLLTLPAGPHLVRFRHPAYEPVERKVSVRPGQTERVVVDLPSEAARKP
jgi:tRNA A-37 threonylcarbamoyl transferase component Bud32